MIVNPQLSSLILRYLISTTALTNLHKYHYFWNKNVKKAQKFLFFLLEQLKVSILNLDFCFQCYVWIIFIKPILREVEIVSG